MAWWQELSQEEVEDYFDDMEFFFQDMKEFGCSALPVGLEDRDYSAEVMAMLAERRWSPALNGTTPSRLWDATIPTTGVTFKGYYDKRTHRKEISLA